MRYDQHNCIPLAKHEVEQADVDAVVAALQSTRLTQGSWTRRFELALAKQLGARHAVAVSSGTAALHVLTASLGLQPGDEVITTPFSYVASTNCILYAGAKPVFVDIDEGTLNIDPGLLKTALSSRSKAILPVHVFGRPCEMDELVRFARENGLEIIEDACEALGSSYKNKAAGTFGRGGAFGFYPNKQITTGEGGAIVTNDSRLANIYRSMRSQGRSGAGLGSGYARLGYNYRMTELQSALGFSQLSRLPQIIAQRKIVTRWYCELIADIEEIELTTLPPKYLNVSWFAFVVRLNKTFTREQRDQILVDLRRQGIKCTTYFPPIHLVPHIRKQFGFRPGDFPVTEGIAARSITLPFYPSLARRDVETVAAALKKAISKLVRRARRV